MEIRKVINEKTSLTLSLWFKDANELPVLPESFTYSLFDEISGQEIIAETTVSPVLANPYTIVIPVDANLILGANSKVEPKVFTVSYLYNSGTEGASKEFKYNVKNLNFL